MQNLQNIMEAWQELQSRQPVCDPTTTINDVLRDHLTVTTAPSEIRREAVQLFDFLHEVISQLQYSDEKLTKTG